MFLDYVFHSHTYRCGHAQKDIDDYVVKCINNGYKKYGVSDHVFLPGVHCPGMRGDYSLLNEYINEYNRCKNIYEKKIEMYLGFECEYSAYYIEYYKSLLYEKGFDYLICGQHLGFDENGKVYSYFDVPDNEEGLFRYRDDLIDAIKSGLFLYVAHPDLFFLFATKVTPIYERITKELLDVFEIFDTVIEININGFLREKTHNGVTYIDYPCDYFWEEVSKRNIRVVVGGDFHNPDVIDDQQVINNVEEFIKRHNLKLVDINDVYNQYQQRIRKY